MVSLSDRNSIADTIKKINRRDRRRYWFGWGSRICAATLTVLAILIAIFVSKGLPVLELVIAYWAVSAVKSACDLFARRM